MSTERNPSELYDAHWAGYEADATATMKSRFTLEAFSRINHFVSDNDRLILEVGCGTGRFCALLAQKHSMAEVIGVDISSNGLNIARRLRGAIACENLLLAEGSVFQLPFSDDLFDMVFCEGLISQFSIGTGGDALREMMRVTKRDGKVLVSEPNWNCLPHTIYKWLKRRLGIRYEYGYEYGYEKSFKSYELIRLFRDLGLSGIESSGFYPAYGFYRLAHYARLFRVIGRVVDTIDNEWFSRLFGFQVIVKGNK